MPVSTVYGTSELAGPAFCTSPHDNHVDTCIGEPVSSVTVKLSDGNSGLLSLKSPGMFTHYVGDEEATQAAFDDEGFYKTGDILRREGNKYFFLGRSSVDWIRFSAFSVSVLEIEDHLLKLPYISEAYVLPIMDYEVRGLVAAVIRLNVPGFDYEAYPDINLQRIRDDLSSTMEQYKLPRVLGEKIPLSPSEKPLKNEMRVKLFQVSGYRTQDYAVPGVEFFGNKLDMDAILNPKKVPSS